jgi:hypothetical protein
MSRLSDFGERACAAIRRADCGDHVVNWGCFLWPAPIVAYAGIALACSASQPPLVIATTQAEVTAYTLESQSCVTLAPTRADADVCVSGVRARWCSPGAPLAAAGACDAGAPAAAVVVIREAGAQ